MESNLVKLLSSKPMTAQPSVPNFNVRVSYYGCMPTRKFRDPMKFIDGISIQNMVLCAARQKRRKRTSGQDENQSRCMWSTRTVCGSRLVCIIPGFPGQSNTLGTISPGRCWDEDENHQNILWIQISGGGSRAASESCHRDLE